jgi:hypothetical protein
MHIFPLPAYPVFNYVAKPHAGIQDVLPFGITALWPLAPERLDHEAEIKGNSGASAARFL